MAGGDGLHTDSRGDNNTPDSFQGFVQAAEKLIGGLQFGVVPRLHSFRYRISRNGDSVHPCFAQPGFYIHDGSQRIIGLLE